MPRLMFLELLFRESPVGLEYLQREVNIHVQGWRSSACVRGMLHKAYDVWSSLERSGRHWPGAIPSGDFPELAQIFHWLVAGEHNRFTTGSGDIVCIAAVLQELGMEVNAVYDTGPAGSDEHRVCVVWNETLFAIHRETSTSPLEARIGMRIPLLCIQECVSLWPGDPSFNNTLRQTFEDGMHAVQRDEMRLKVHPQLPATHYYLKARDATPGQKRLTSLESRMLECMLPDHAYEAARALSGRIARWSEESRRQLSDVVTNASSQDALFADLTVHMPSERLAELQSFFLGYYYTLCLQVVDQGLLQVPEAFGGWAHQDAALLRRLSRMVNQPNLKSQRGSKGPAPVPDRPY